MNRYEAFGDSSKIKPLNGREIELTTIGECHEVIDEPTNMITELRMDDGCIVNLGDIISINSFPYNGNLMYKVNNITYYRSFQDKHVYFLKQDVKNLTTFLLLPFFGGGVNYFRIKGSTGITPNFINAYTECEFFDTGEKADYKVYLLYKFIKDASFVKFEKELMSKSYYLGKIEPDDNHCLYELKIPDKFKSQVDIIHQSKYSKLDDSIKQRIIKFNKLQDNSVLAQSLYQTEARRLQIEEEYGVKLPRDAELFEAFEGNTLTKQHIFETNKII